MRSPGLPRSLVLPLAGAAFLLGTVCADGGAAAAVGPDGLGRIEREALDEALASRGLGIHPSPEGKRVAQVHVVTLEVFSRQDGPFEWFNLFHRTSREWAIRRESLVLAGDRYDADRVAETTRNLQADSSLSAVVVVVPVRAPNPETVDLLIVTRDVWSLRLNTDFEIQAGYLVSLTTSLSENNLFGWRKRVAMVADLDQGNLEVGPSYVDPNMRGSRLSLRTSLRAVVARDGGAFEGTKSRVILAHPLYSLASRWGGSLDFGHVDEVARPFFLGAEMARKDLAATSEPDDLPWTYRARQVTVQTSIVRSFSGAVVHRIGAGHGFAVVRPGFAPGFPDDPALRAAFAAEVFPPSERVSSLRLSYSMFVPTYRTIRDLNTFDLRENFRLGPSADAWVARALRVLGSDRDSYGLGAGAAFTWDALGGVERISAGWSGRIESGTLSDQFYSAGAYAASPVLCRAVRVVAEFEAAVLLDDTRNRVPFVLGGTSGLRGHTIGDLQGQAQIVGHVEVRSMPVAFRALRLGGLVFYDVGDAATPDPVDSRAAPVRALRTLLALRAQHDLGLGLRLLIPQLDPYVIRFDWAFATSTTTGPTGIVRTRAGWPGRLSFGFRQAF